MKVLVLSPICPVPVSAGHQRYLDGILKILLAGGNEISLYVLNSREKAKSEEIEQRIKSAYFDLARIMVSQHPKFTKNKLRKLSHAIRVKLMSGEISNELTCPHSFVKRVRKDIDKYDAVICFYASMSNCIPKEYKGKKIIFTNDIQTNILRSAQKIGIRKEVNVSEYQKEEISLLNKFNTVVAINRNELNWFKKVCPQASMKLIYPQMEINKKEASNKDIDLLFVGSPSPFNINGIKRFIEGVLPKLKKEFPEIKLAVAGGVSKTMSLGSLQKKFPNNVKLLGVIKNIDSAYERCKIVISPIYDGAGAKVKNFEAMAKGKVVIGTKFSFDGINITNGKNAVIANSNEEFASQISKLLKDKERVDKLSKSAIKYIEETNRRNIDELNSIIPPTVTTKPCKTTNKRLRALIYTSDAQKIVGYNLFFANALKKVGVYVEFLKKDASNAGKINSEGYLTYSLNDKLNRALRKKILSDEKLYSKNSEGDYISIKYKDWNISEEFNIYKKMFPEHFETEEKSRNVISFCLMCLDGLLEVIRNNKPDILVGWNGNGAAFNFLIKVAGKLSRLPVIHLERGLVPNSICVSNKGVNFESDLASSYLPIISSAEEREAYQYIERFREERKTVVATTMSNVTIASIGLREKAYLFFPMQIDTDSNIILNSYKWKRMEDVLDELTKVYKETGIKILCRPHPENKNIALKEYPGIIFNSELGLHDSIAGALATVVINSTVGLESILIGTPTITLGNSIYSTKGCTYEARNYIGIVEAINKIKEKQSAKDIRVARFVTLLFNDYVLRQDISDDGLIKFMRGLLERLGWKDYAQKPYVLPKLAKKNYETYNKFESLIKNKENAIYIDTTDVEGEELWFDGANRYVATKETLSSLFEEKFQRPVAKAMGDESNTIVLKMVRDKNHAKLIKDRNVLFTDKYFYPIEISETFK